jgi:hypothetical protein
LRISTAVLFHIHFPSFDGRKVESRTVHPIARFSTECSATNFLNRMKRKRGTRIENGSASVLKHLKDWSHQHGKTCISYINIPYLKLQYEYKLGLLSNRKFTAKPTIVMLKKHTYYGKCTVSFYHKLTMWVS